MTDLAESDRAAAREVSHLWPIAALVGLLGAALVGIAFAYVENRRIAADAALEAQRIEAAQKPGELEAFIAFCGRMASMQCACATTVGLRPHADRAVAFCQDQAAAGWPASVPVLDVENLNGIGGPE